MHIGKTISVHLIDNGGARGLITKHIGKTIYCLWYVEYD